MTQYYIGVKQIMAWPQQKDGQDGYAVKYPDGYISWSPKATFEAAYLPMGEGNDGSRITPEMVRAFITGPQRIERMGNHAVVHVGLRNGFSLIEESACVDAKNYDEGIGVELAMKKAENRVWHLLGFLLASARNGILPRLTSNETKAD